MDGRLKQRMVGAAVIVALGVIFIPVLLDESGRKQQLEPVPDMPEQPTPPKPIEINPEPITLSAPAVEVVDEPAADPAPPAKETPKAGVDTGDLSAWVVQLGSFSDRKNAEQLTSTLQEAGFTAFIEAVTSGGKTAHRVRVGPVMTKQKADQIRKRINKNHKQQGVVLRYSGPQGEG